jgi:2-polyprenyl-6-methoxyphenol hydroxylase-like FAD-dependent oxidoreductase
VPIDSPLLRQSAAQRVLIIGAGPTGLTLANCLSAYGVPFLLIDRKRGVSQDSKALAINPLSQMLMTLIDRGSVLGREGCRVNRMNVVWCGRRLNPVDFRWLDFGIRDFITQPQATTERELLSALDPGSTVHWQTECLAVREGARQVTAVLRHADGSEREESFAFVAGCEGKSSVIREHLGAVLQGKDYPMHFVLGDFCLNWAAKPDQAHYLVFEQTFFVIVPVSRTHWRVVVKYDGDYDPLSPVRPSDVTSVTTKYFGSGFVQGEPTWLSRAPFYLRTASHLASERSFICGDAAHLYSPIGGTGMNTGMQDAFNLAWKLAYVWHGFASSALLGSYEQERLEVIQRTAATTDLTTRLIARSEQDPARVEAFMPSLANRRRVTGELPWTYSGVGLRYTRSLALATRKLEGDLPIGEVCHGLLALRRALFAGVRPHGSWISDALASHVVIAGTVAVLRAERREMISFRGWLTRRFPFVRVCILALDGSSPLADMDPIPEFSARLNPSRASLFMLRPDGVIAFSNAFVERRHLVDLLSAISSSKQTTDVNWLDA